MSFKEDVADLAKRAISAQTVAHTEEATKTAVVMPFLRTLGFDVFDPAQVIPEFIADVGLKRGEKVDYAIKISGKIEILVEDKSLTTSLSDAEFSQLFRYFHVTEAKLAILTNGQNFWFFTDIDAENKMDQTPFFKFDLLSYDDGDLKELEKFHRSTFDIARIQSAASSLKHTKAAISYLEEQWANPDDDFVRLVARRFYEGKLTASVVEALKPVIRRAFYDLVRQRIRRKFAAALDDDIQEDEIPEFDDSGIETTDEELQGFQIVRAIAAEVVPVSRIFIRDAKSYCAILFDDNNRTPVARLHFNGGTKYISTFDSDKQPVRYDIQTVEDIFGAKEAIVKTVRHYLDKSQN